MRTARATQKQANMALEVGGLIAVRRCKKRLWLYGALAGTLYAVLAFIVFSAVAGTLYVSIALLSDIAIGAVSGLLSVMVLQMLK